MPYPNEHAARQAPPGNFERFRRTKPKGFPKGVSAIIGFKRGGGSAIQSLRFDKKIWTPKRARAWLKSHNFKTGLEEAAAKGVSWKGLL